MTTLRWALDNTEIDPVAYGIHSVKLRISYTHPAVLTWSVYAAQATIPIPRSAKIRVWDADGVSPITGAAYSMSAPLFRGWIEDIQPAANFQVDYTAMDPTRRAAAEVVAHLLPWIDGTTTDGDSVPRVVYNCKIEADPDYGASRSFDATVGEIIQFLLENQQAPLEYRDASAATAFESADLSPLTTKPQEKVTFESESIRSCIERLIRYEPEYRLLFDCATRKWRIRSLTGCPQVTLRLNDASETYPVLSFSLRQSTEARASAVKIYGPETSLVREFRWHKDLADYPAAPSYNWLLTPGESIVLEEYSTGGGGMQEAVAYRTYQIQDTELRRGVGLFSEIASTALTAFDTALIDRPTLYLSWDKGVTWIAQNTLIDLQRGIARIVGAVPFQNQQWRSGALVVAGSTQTKFPANAAKLVFGTFEPPLSVRYPETGFSGPVYSVMGRSIEREYYDEALAVGREYGIPVTTTERRNAFITLAAKIHSEASKLRWAGGAVLDGIDYSFASLNRRINFTALDPTGTEFTTGWEAIDAYLTDVEYDFSGPGTTTLTLDSSALEAAGLDVETLKRELGIRPKTQVEFFQTIIIFRDFINETGQRIQQAAGVQTFQSFGYVDELTGRFEV